MSDWLDIYRFLISAILSFMARFWVILTEHFWVVFPFMVAIICGFISLFLWMLFKVIRNV